MKMLLLLFKTKKERELLTYLLTPLDRPTIHLFSSSFLFSITLYTEEGVRKKSVLLACTYVRRKTAFIYLSFQLIEQMYYKSE